MTDKFGNWLSSNDLNVSILKRFGHLEKEDLDDIYGYVRQAFEGGQTLSKLHPDSHASSNELALEYVSDGSFDSFFE